MMFTDTLALIWRPYFPMAVTLTVVGTLLGLAWWSFARSGRQCGIVGSAALVLRCVLIALMGLLLIGPSGARPGRQLAERPVLRLLVDSSASMQTADMDGLPRIDYAIERWLTPARLGALCEVHDVELYAFDESLRAVGGDWLRRPGKDIATGGVSNIARAVTDSVIGHRPKGSAVVVFSDGRDTLDMPMGAVGELAYARSIPIYSVPLGGTSLSRDVAVIAVPREPYLFAGEPGLVAVRVMQSNAGSRGTVLHVAQHEQVQAFPIQFDGRESVAVDVPIKHDQPGTYEYRVWADPIEGEADGANNAQPVFIAVTGKRLRVLILEGQPYWDTKFLAHALRKDERIELTQVTQLSADRRETIVSREGAIAEMPDTPDALGRYDVVILGRGIGRLLDEPSASLLPTYVSDRGGRLVFARGRAYDPGEDDDGGLQRALSVLEPVVFGRGVLHHQRIELDATGMLEPGFGEASWSVGATSLQNETDLPTLLNVPVVLREKAAARVLARTVAGGSGSNSDIGQPAIVTMPYGQGMVVAVLGEGLWRWGLRPRHEGNREEGFDRFWMDLVRWLALGSEYQPGKVLSLRLSRSSVQSGDPISLDLVSRVGFDGLDTVVAIEGPSGERSLLALSPVEGSTTRRRAVFNAKSKGVYRVVATSAQLPEDTIEAKFNCYDVDIERMHSSANREALRRLSESSGGRCLNPDEPDALLKLLSLEREAATSPPKPYYLWDRGWVLTLVLSWTGLEWIVRRSGGLP